MTDSLSRELIAAAWDNDLDAASRLIAAGAEVNAQDNTQQSTYLIATSEGYLDLLRLTLAHGADVSAKDSYNGTGLIRAADRGHAPIIAVLIKADTEVNHINRLGWTALHEAIILGNGDDRYVDCVRLLLAAGAHPLLPSQQDGISPLHHAESRGFSTIAATIRRVNEGQPVVDARAALDTAVLADDADGIVLALRSGGFSLGLEAPMPPTEIANDGSARLLALISL